MATVTVMLRPSSSPSRTLRSSLLLLTAALVPLLAQPACGSDDAKKSPRKTQAGGEGGEDATAGGSQSAPEAGSGGTETSEAGSGGSAGQAPVSEGGGAGIECPTGTADCDDDPTDCEEDVTTLEQCGACGVACSQDNGTTICGEAGCEVTSCTEPYHDCNDTGTDGCEATLDTVDNCGFCGHSCGEAACTNALCAGTVVGSPGGAYRWAQTSDALYRITGNNPNYGLATNYTLVKLPLDGSPETTVASGAISPGGLAVDDTSVYWALKGSPSAVVKKAHDAAPASGPVPVFDTNGLHAPVQMRIQDGDLYFVADDGIIYKRALDAAMSDHGTALVGVNEVRGSGTFGIHQDFVITPTVMYWVVPTAGNQAIIRTAPLTGGTASDVPGALTSPYLKLSVSGEDLYWVQATGAALDGVYHYTAGGEVTPLVLQPSLTAVVADADFLYMTGGTFNNTLFRAPIEGGTSITLGDTSGLNYAMDIGAVSADRVFVITSFTHGAGFFSGNPTVAYPK